MGVAIAIITSVIGSLIFTILLYLFGVLGRFMPKIISKSHNELSIEKVFVNQKHAIKAINKDILASKTLKVFALKGDTFSHPREEEDSLNNVLHNKNITQKYLISSACNPYIITRGKELGNDNLSDAIELSIKNFKKNAKINNTIELRLHNEIVRFRLIILDEILYLSFQQPDKIGRKAPILRIKKLSPIYFAFLSYFDELWEKCIENSIAKSEQVSIN